MRWVRTTAVCGGLFVAALSVDLRVGSLELGSAAHAIVGRPATPVSYAGAARRTARHTTRAVVATSAATATAVAVTSSAARAAAPPPPPPPAGLPVGTIVSALPPGCVTRTIGGVSYSDCGGVYYRAAFQSNNLVYVVQQP